MGEKFRVWCVGSDLTGRMADYSNGFRVTHARSDDIAVIAFNYMPCLGPCHCLCKQCDRQNFLCRLLGAAE